ncbi:MAG: RNA chaperone Hfq [Acidobacteria bacterium]|nr:RNA chaperone Hfq [Acidobacteriota bacterium]
MDSTAARRALEPAAEGASPEPAPAPVTNDFANRRLIRPYIARDGNRDGNRSEFARDRASSRKAAPPEQTHAENFYYQKQMQTRTPMVLVLKDGEQVHGCIEWYDKDCLKITRTGGQSNLLVYKPAIKYIYKESENGRK